MNEMSRRPPPSASSNSKVKRRKGLGGSWQGGRGCNWRAGNWGGGWSGCPTKRQPCLRWTGPAGLTLKPCH